jgi:hypothetical protein
MPNYQETPIVPDLRRVNIHEEQELNYWAKEFRISERELKLARNGSGYIC